MSPLDVVALLPALILCFWVGNCGGVDILCAEDRPHRWPPLFQRPHFGRLPGNVIQIKAQTPAHSPKYKLKALKTHFDNQPANDLVIVADSSVLWGGCRTDYASTYQTIISEQRDAPLLFSVDLRCEGRRHRTSGSGCSEYPLPPPHVMERTKPIQPEELQKYSLVHNRQEEHQFMKYMNNGLFMGPGDAIKAAVEWMLNEKECITEAECWTRYYIAHKAKISFDYESLLFFNMDGFDKKVTAVQNEGNIYSPLFERTMCFIRKSTVYWRHVEVIYEEVRDIVLNDNAGSVWEDDVKPQQCKPPNQLRWWISKETECNASTQLSEQKKEEARDLAALRATTSRQIKKDDWVKVSLEKGARKLQDTTYTTYAPDPGLYSTAKFGEQSLTLQEYYSRPIVTAVDVLKEEKQFSHVKTDSLLANWATTGYPITTEQADNTTPKQYCDEDHASIGFASWVGRRQNEICVPSSKSSQSEADVLSNTYIQCFARQAPLYTPPLAEAVCEMSNIALNLETYHPRQMDAGAISDRNHFIHLDLYGDCNGTINQNSFQWNGAGMPDVLRRGFAATSKRIPCDMWIDHPVYLLWKYDSKSPYHNMQDVLQTFITFSMTALPPTETQIIVVDQPHGALTSDKVSLLPLLHVQKYQATGKTKDEQFNVLYDTLFSNARQITYLEDIKRDNPSVKNVCLRRAVSGPHGGTSPLSRAKRKQTFCNSPLYHTFVSTVLKKIHFSYPPITDPEAINVVFLERSKGLKRLLTGAQQFLDKLPETWTKKIINPEHLTPEDQIRAVASADIIVGAHGASFVWTMFMRPTGAVVEVQHSSRRGNWQFANLAHFRGLLWVAVGVQADPAAIPEATATYMQKVAAEVVKRRNQWKELYGGKEEPTAKSVADQIKKFQREGEEFRATSKGSRNARTSTGATMIRGISGEKDIKK